MFHRSLPDVAPTTDANLDTAAMAAGEAAAERAEHDLRVLVELTDIGMKLARSLGALADARAEAALLENRALTPVEAGSVAAFNKVAQTVRRTVALRERADAHATTRRQGLAAERARRRADLDAEHVAAKSEAIIGGLHDAYAADRPDAEYYEFVDLLMEEARDHLDDADEFRGWLDRPVGETVERLCAALGLDPGACVLDGETWTVRRPETGFEMQVAKRDEKYPRSPPFPPLHGEGGSERSDETGGERRSDHDPTVICGSSISGADPPASPASSTVPHPAGFAVCPSP